MITLKEFEEIMRKRLCAGMYTIKGAQKVSEPKFLSARKKYLILALKQHAIFVNA